MKQKSTFSWVLDFAGRRRSFFAGSVLLAILGVAVSLIPYLIMGKIISELMGGNRDWQFYLMQCVYMAIAWAGRVIFHSVSTSMSHMATYEVLAGIRRQITKKLQEVPLGDVLDEASGTFKNIIVERVDSVEKTLAHIVPEFTANLLLPICLFVYICVLDWRMALAMFIGPVIGVVFACFMMVGNAESFQLTLDKTKQLNDTAVEYIGGIEVIKAFGKTGTSYEKFVIAAREGADCFIDWMRRCIWPSAGMLSFAPATYLGLLPIGVLLLINGSLSPETFIYIMILAAGLVTPLVIAFSYMDDIQKMQAIFNDVTGILVMEEMERPEELTEEISGSEIVLEDVHFSYKDKEVLHGVNMTITPGTVNAIVGPSGSGKTTIVRLIDSLWDPDSGRITYGGVDIKNIPLGLYMKQIAYVSQDNFLFDETVMENIRMGKNGATDEEVIEAAKRCGCHDFIMSLENGYGTMVGGSGGHLSGGERQRISIARAMLKDAPIVILDEATAYTDPENEALIQASIARLVKDKTLIVIAHRLSTIADVDRIFLVNDGNVVCSGTQQELLDGSDLYRRMWEAHRYAKDTDAEEGVQNA
ncbi:MAG: ABC transporter ATP-binding protein/permease [Eubacterium sp.]|nr:ABC transporter ATP-binding protein/permease [Eubacterium sp.]